MANEVKEAMEFSNVFLDYLQFCEDKKAVMTTYTEEMKLLRYLVYRGVVQ